MCEKPLIYKCFDQMISSHMARKLCQKKMNGRSFNGKRGACCNKRIVHMITVGQAIKDVFMTA